ncbi:MAG: hypothetical protein JJU06_03700 [Ectothiorhodospiraceae bacterium]|nr:hypothetical protein [Ectothiorhodospiraceae bacterium]
MKILWRHIVARFKPRLSYTDIERIFRFYARACAREEPVLAYTDALRKAHAESDPIEDLVAVVAPRLRDIANEREKAEQARECRATLLEQVDRAVPDHFLSRGGDESLRHVCLAAIYNLESEEEVRGKEYESLMSYCRALWGEAALACLYEEQFGSYMPLNDFSKPYRAMSELYVRFLCTKLFSHVMSEHDRSDLKSISAAYEAACADSTVAELGEIRSHYFDAIRRGFVDHLYPLQERFASLSQSAQASIEAALGETRLETYGSES